MGSTFISICNTVLRRFNEVEIDISAFASARGIQSLVKDCVRNSIAKINQAEYSWPFNAAEYTQTLIVGQEEYSWPSDLKVPEWDSFQLQESASLGSSFTKLVFISTNQWFQQHRDLDDASSTSGRGVPIYVFPSHGTGWGLTPSPDKSYNIKYRYFKNQQTLSAYNDTTRIPSQYDNVIVDGAMVEMYMFKDNGEAAQLAQVLFEKGIKNMQSILINQFESIRDTRINQSNMTTLFNGFNA